MDHVYGVVGKLLGTRGSPRARKQQTVRMDATSRRALQTAVREETGDIQDDLTAVCRELATAVEQYEAAVQKEQFLGVRIRKYQTALDQRASEFKTEQHELATATAAPPATEAEAATACSRTEDGRTEEEEKQGGTDEEEGELSLEARQADFERRMEQWEKDQDALQKIVQTHKEILISCEEMRRAIDVLEKKKKVIETMSTECDEFLTTAREADFKQSEQHNTDGEHELSMGRDEQDQPLNEMEMTNRPSENNDVESAGVSAGDTSGNTT